MKCENLCKYSEKMCEFCQENYNVSSTFYEANRANTKGKVVGYLVRDKEDKVMGILNKDTHFMELSWIDETTLREIIE